MRSWRAPALQPFAQRGPACVTPRAHGRTLPIPSHSCGVRAPSACIATVLLQLLVGHLHLRQTPAHRLLVPSSRFARPGLCLSLLVVNLVEPLCLITDYIITTPV